MTKGFSLSRALDALQSPDPDTVHQAAASCAAAAPALLEQGKLEPVLLAAALARGQDAAPLLEALAAEDLDEALLALWDDQWGARQAATMLALRRGDQLQGPLAGFLLAEVENLDPEEHSDVLLIQSCLERLLQVAPQEAFSLAGLCSLVTAQAAEGLEPTAKEDAVQSLARSLSGAQLPHPQDAWAALVLDLMGTVVGQSALELVAAQDQGSVVAVAGALALRCLEVTLGAASAMHEVNPQAEDQPEYADPEIMRGAMDLLQIPYEDLARDRWLARLRYQDEFEQWQSASLSIGLTARRVTLRLTHPYGDQAVVDPRSLLERNLQASLSRVALNLEGVPCIIAELPRQGFSLANFEMALDDLRATLEHILNPR